MSESFDDLLKRLSVTNDPKERNEIAHHLQGLALQLAGILQGVNDAGARREILAYFSDATSDHASRGEGLPAPMKLTPELLEWALKQYSEEEIIAGMNEIRATGGFQLADFIEEIEKEAMPRE